MELTIKSRRLGQEITFSRPGGSYIYCDLGTSYAVGSLGCQICDGGRLIGSTISYRGDKEEEFAAVCRQWWRSYIKRNS